MSDPGHRLAGTLTLKLNNLPSAATHFAQATMLNPADKKAAFSFANIIRRIEDTIHAILLHSNNISKWPKEANSHHDLSLCYSSKKHHKSALNHLNKAVTLDPSNKSYIAKLEKVHSVVHSS